MRIGSMLLIVAALAHGCSPTERERTNPWDPETGDFDFDGDGVPNKDDSDPTNPSCGRTDSDVENCGECDHRCVDDYPHATVQCVDGRCSATGCETGWFDVNGDLDDESKSDGCECETDDPLTDVNNCGICGHGCPALYKRTTPTCVGGECDHACMAGWSDVDGDLGDGGSNGCECQTEDPLTDLFNCGACGRMCSASNADASCVSGNCLYECHFGWFDVNDDLDQDVGDGCECETEDPLTDLFNCGACGRICSAANADAFCVSGDCLHTCHVGWSDVNDDLYQDGGDGCECETDDPMSDVNNCGTCGRVCSAANADASCENGNCLYKCHVGMFDVNGDLEHDSGDGCECETEDPLTDSNNCGECGNVCGDRTHAETACAGGQCQYECDSGWFDVNLDLFSDRSDGCECETEDPLTDVKNCGVCGHGCADDYPHAFVICSAGHCSATGCSAGWSDVNGDLGSDSSDGCECETDNPMIDVENCGECGHRCSDEYPHAVVECSGGDCVFAACEPGWSDPDGDPETGCECLNQTEGSAGEVCCEVSNGDICCESTQGYQKCEPADGRGGPYVVIPAATFWMGCRDDLNGAWDCETDGREEPQHEVRLSSYGIDVHEVTQAEYQAFVVDTNHREPTECTSGSPTWDPIGTPEYPVACVSWDDLQAYCQWLGGDLPTEAQWEYAARGPMANADDYAIFPWGTNEIDCGRAVFNAPGDGGCEPGAAWPVCSKRIGDSPFGLCDLSGNVWEWCLDWYDSDYYSFSQLQDPEGPTNGESRVMRGGSWGHGRTLARSADRRTHFPTYSTSYGGGRCVRY